MADEKKAVREEDLEFEQVRSGTDQWVVSVGGKQLGWVTERVIAQPAYAVVRASDRHEEFRDTRDEVTEVLLGWAQ